MDAVENKLVLAKEFLSCDGVSTLIKALSQRAKDIEEFIRNRFDLLIQEINSINDRRLKNERRECERAAKKWKRKALAFLNRRKNMFQHMNHEAESVKESFRRGNASCLLAFIDEVKTHMKQCKSSYESLDEAHHQVTAKCGNLEEECDGKKRWANNAKFVAGVGGGGIAGAAAVTTVASGVSAGALAVGVLLGPVTLGLGTAVGLAVAGGAATVGAVVAGVGTAATVKVAGDMAKKERSLKGICDNLKEMHQSLEELSDKVDAAYDVVENLEPEVEYFKEKVEVLLEEDKIDSVCKALDRFLEQVREVS